jgi:hypothetical protein
LLADPLPVVPVFVVPVFVVPVFVVPVFVVPVFVVPVFVPPDEVSVGLELVLPETGEFDAGGADVEEALPGVDEDTDVVGLAVSGGAAICVGHCVPAAVADVSPPVALVLAFAEAVEVAVLVAVPLARPVVAVPVVVVPVVVVPVVVVVSLAPAPPPLTVLPSDPLSVTVLGGLVGGLLTGVSLGATDLADSDGLAAVDEDETVGHAVAGWLLGAAEVPPWLVPSAPELYWVPAPLTPGTPLPVLELEIPTAELSWTKAWRSGGTASATPMANTTHAAARAGRSSLYRHSRCCRA